MTIRILYLSRNGQKTDHKQYLHPKKPKEDSQAIFCLKQRDKGTKKAAVLLRHSVLLLTFVSKHFPPIVVNVLEWRIFFWRCCISTSSYGGYSNVPALTQMQILLYLLGTLLPQNDSKL